MIKELCVNLKKHRFFAFSSIILFFHCIVVITHSINIPYWDDYVFISVIAEIQQSGTFLDIVRELFKPHNEHIIFITKLIYYIQYLFTGSINFKGGIIVGTAFLYISISTLFIAEFKLDKGRVLLIISLLLLIPINNLTNWSMVSIGWNGTICISLLSFYFLSEFLAGNKIKYLLISIAFMILGPFSMANGILIGFIGVIVQIIFRGYGIKNHLSSFFLYTATALVSLLLYLNSIIGSKNIEVDETSGDILMGSYQVIMHFIIFISSPAKDLLNNNVTILGFLGFVILILMLALIFRNYQSIQKDPFYLMVGLFVLGSMFLISIGRSEISVEQGLRSRYLLLPLTLWFILFRLFCLELAGNKILNFINCFIIVSLILYLNKTSVNIELMKSRKIELNEGLYTYWGDNDYSKLAYPEPMIKIAADRLKLGETRSIYSSKLAIESTKIISNIKFSARAFEDDFIHREKTVFSSEDLLIIKGWIYPKYINEYRIYATVETSNSFVTLLPDKDARKDVRVFLEKDLNIKLNKYDYGYKIIYPIFEKDNLSSMKVNLIVEDIDTKEFYKQLVFKH